MRFLFCANIETVGFFPSTGACTGPICSRQSKTSVSGPRYTGPICYSSNVVAKLISTWYPLHVWEGKHIKVLLCQWSQKGHVKSPSGPTPSGFALDGPWAFVGRICLDLGFQHRGRGMRDQGRSGGRWNLENPKSLMRSQQECNSPSDWGNQNEFGTSLWEHSDLGDAHANLAILQCCILFFLWNTDPGGSWTFRWYKRTCPSCPHRCRSRAASKTAGPWKPPTVRSITTMLLASFSPTWTTEILKWWRPALSESVAGGSGEFERVCLSWFNGFNAESRTCPNCSDRSTTVCETVPN